VVRASAKIPDLFLVGSGHRPPTRGFHRPPTTYPGFYLPPTRGLPGKFPKSTTDPLPGVYHPPTRGFLTTPLTYPGFHLPPTRVYTPLTRGLHTTYPGLPGNFPKSPPPTYPGFHLHLTIPPPPPGPIRLPPTLRAIPDPRYPLPSPGPNTSTFHTLFFSLDITLIFRQYFGISLLIGNCPGPDHPRPTRGLHTTYPGFPHRIQLAQG
jgi:hypothetical protein